MKKITNFIFALIMIPVLFFSGCTKSTALPAIDLATYFKNDITITDFDINTSTNSLSLLTATSPNEDNLSNYLKFEISAQSTWIYKMFIESISFYVYTNANTTSQMTINLEMTNLISEEDLKNSTTDLPAVDTVKEQCSINLTAKQALKCTININKVIAVATGSNLTLDIINSPELFSDNPDFKWLIYGLEVHGESRAYSR